MTDHPNQPSWQLDRGFWLSHLLLPLLLAGALLTLLEHTGLDLWLEDRWFALEGFRWAWRNSWLASTIIHVHGRQLIAAIAFTLLAALALGTKFQSLRDWRRPLVYLLLSIIALPALVAAWKHFSQVPCPWDLARYGGLAAYRHNLAYPLGNVHAGHCFPSGHASGGFALLSCYFAAYLNTDRKLRWLWPGMLTGWVFGLGQQARGAHFLSHDLWSLAWCWFGALALFLLVRPARSGGPCALDSRSGQR